jgi:hypothetical protein
MADSSGGLKFRKFQFQQCSIDWCSRQIIDNPKRPVRRFLVADEVGLGKTIIARGVIDKLRQGKRNCCVVYFCSSLDIINQNRNKLDPSAGAGQNHAGRITLIRSRQEYRNNRMYFFTPGTSLFITNSTGMVEERLYMAWLVKRIFNIHGNRLVEIFKCNAPSFGEKFHGLHRHEFDLRKTDEDALRKAWQPYLLRLRSEDTAKCKPMVKEMRSKLAKIMLQSLNPGLIILDEFQKYKEILNQSNNGGKQKQTINSDFLKPAIPTLLLSATPYHHSPEEDNQADQKLSENDDLLKVLSFLTNSPEDGQALRLRIEDHGHKVRSLTVECWRDKLQVLIEEKSELEKELKKIMSRTERIFFQFDEDGAVATKFLSKSKITPAITKDEVKEYLLLASCTHKRELLAYWKSGGYLMSYIQDYAVGKKILKHSHVARNPFLYSNSRAERPRNRKIDYVLKDIFKREEAYRYLWIPPLKPYYEGDGIFSKESTKSLDIKKGLVFSAWKFVPRQVAVEISGIRDAHFRGHSKYQIKATPVTWASFFFPSKVLAECLTHEDFVTAGSYTALRKIARNNLIKKLSEHGITERSKTSSKAWEILRHLEFSGAPEAWKQLIRDYRRHVSKARQEEATRRQLFEDRYLNNLNKRFSTAPRINRKVIEELVDIAIASPAVTMMRALHTVAGSKLFRSRDHLLELQRVCLIELRSFLSRPTTVQCIRAEIKRGSYADRVLEYFRNGNIQAVFDEYLFCIGGGVDPISITAEELTDILDKLRCIFQHHRSILRPYTSNKDRPRVSTNVAMAFGESSEEGTSRDDLRTSFNSPFWPFILATTSVGQEGLDFHLYCRNIYHWNFSMNPVSFEQREGRLMRFNSLAIRQGAIATIGDIERGQMNDATFWQHAFNDATKRCHYNDRYNLDLSPNWILTSNIKAKENDDDPTKLVRHVLDLPNSSDKNRYNRLMNQLRLYRLALGQPNPDRYLKQLESNGFLKTIDTRSLYLNLFPFEEVDRKNRSEKILNDPDLLQMLVTDARKKADELDKGKDQDACRTLVNKATDIIHEALESKNGIKNEQRKIVEALLDFVDVHDEINDRIPEIGYKDDLACLQSALSDTQ